MNYDAIFGSSVWGPVGVVVSVLFGFCGIYLAVRSRYSGKITFVNEQMIELFDAVGNSLDGLTVTYDGNTVDENLVLLNGAFINSGKTDIEPRMVEQPITLKLPDGYKWLTGKIIKCNENTNATLKVKDANSIEINTGLFRCNECVRFNALAQIPDEKNSNTSLSKKLHSALKFEHRITNTKKIEETSVKDKTTNSKELKRRGIPLLGMLVLIIIVCIFSVYKGVPKSLIFPLKLDGNRTEYVCVKTSSKTNILKLNSIESDFEIDLPFNDFLIKTKGLPKLHEGPESKFTELLILISVQMLMPLLLIASRVYIYLKNKKLLKIIGEL